MKDDKIYLLHIRDAIDQINQYTSEGQSAFIKDPKTRDAVLRQLEIIGEATKNISQTLRENNPSIPWKKISGLRDKVIHEYFGVNLELVWNVVENQLPILKGNIAKLLAK